MGQPPTIKFSKEELPTSAVGQGQVSPNGRGGQAEVPPRSYPNDADARYAAALKLVQAIDRNLQYGTQHYYDTEGRLLNTLDEVIHAMLTDSLASGKPRERPKDAEAVVWKPVSELVA
jgi:hypothetical protein